ncbi:hypothetical protein DPMN_191856 [Dreissena polymorpha]|uniref:Uncharacterized protein n=1 Tax=Dreissena polymorpha TaxID=45954 RepID=A0A9D3Y171_DREPO|nr:hypothetical protein DPMN_191856 [Dreissena polymorpha]
MLLQQCKNRSSSLCTNIHITTRAITWKTAALLVVFNNVWTINATFRVFKWLDYRHKKKTAPPLDGHINVMTKFIADWTINMTYRVFAMKPAPFPGAHVYRLTRSIFEFS